MSDGITEAYRAGRAYKDFEELFKEAAAEHILLIDEKKKMSKDQMFDFLIENTNGIEIQKQNRYKRVHKEYGVVYSSSIASSERDKWEYVDYYSMDVRFPGVYKTFQAETVEECMREAVAFGAILQTPKGKLALEAYHRY